MKASIVDHRLKSVKLQDRINILEKENNNLIIELERTAILAAEARKLLSDMDRIPKEDYNKLDNILGKIACGDEFPIQENFNK